MLDVSGLSVSYGKHQALDKASLHVTKGEIVVILGANGAGKSTLLRAISGICEGQVTGSVTMNGTDILGRPANEIVAEGLALVPEGRGIFGDLSVQDNLTLGAYPDRARDEEAGNLNRVFTLFPKLHERRRQVVRTMSGGEQQMVAIGRAMMSNPSILALDEPSLGLSPLLCKELFQSLKTVRQAGLGILLVEQNARQSLAIADRGYLLESGKIIHEDTATALMDDPAVRKAYLGGTGGVAVAPSKSQAAAAGPSAAAAKAPAASQAAARSPAISPSDIAAQAIAGLQTRRDKAPTPKPVPRPAQGPAPATVAPAPDALTRPRNGAAKPTTGGIRDLNIDDLVARASEVSDRRNKGTHGVSGRHPTQPEPRSTPKTPMPKMPDLGSSSDRLQAAIREIEDAARRAETYRPSRKSS